MTTHTRPAKPKHDPVGAHPVKQARSQKLRDDLIRHGRRLIETKGYDGTSMADIAKAAGCSVGALYYRFKDKEALFDAVVDVAMKQSLENLEADVAAARYDTQDPDAMIALCLGDYMAFMGANSKLIRVLYERNLSQPHYWAIVRGTVEHMVKTWMRLVILSADRRGDRAYASRVGIAFQFATGVMLYSVLIQPPIRELSPQEQHFWLVQMVRHFLSVETGSLPPLPDLVKLRLTEKDT